MIYEEFPRLNNAHRAMMLRFLGKCLKKSIESVDVNLSCTFVRSCRLKMVLEFFKEKGAFNSYLLGNDSASSYEANFRINFKVGNGMIAIYITGKKKLGSAYWTADNVRIYVNGNKMP